MAITAGVGGKMLIMIKSGVIREQDLLDRMTFTACPDTKSGFAVMARSARFPLVHFGHGKAPGSGPGCYNFVMALTAGQLVAMFYVTERNRAGILDGENRVGRGGWVTFFTVSTDTESRLAVVTGAARFSTLHLLHRITDTADPSDKNCTVTFIAFEHLEMIDMAESGVKRLESYVYDVLMTFLAIALNGKCGISVVAGSARLSRFHIEHGVAHPVRPGNKNLVVTFRAGKRHLEMG